MRKIISFTTSILLLCLILISCDKIKRDVVKSDAELLQDFFKRNIVPTQNFTIDAGAGGVINTAQGTRIEFPPNALVTATGSAVSGIVNIEFKEINEKIDFVLSNKPTIANGLPLESGGTWKLDINQNGQRLRIRRGAFVLMNIKRDAGQQRNMFLFNALAKENDAAALNWGQPRQQIIPLDTPYRNYFCKLDSVSWGNADVFMDNPDYARNIKVFGFENNITPNLSNFSAMFIYKGRKTVWPLESNTGTFFTDNHIAKGQPGHFVVFGFVNGAFKAGILEDQTIGRDDENFSVNLTYNDEASFKARLRAIL